MRVVGISGSPRKEGNTAILVNEVLKHLRGKKKFISLADLDIHPCDMCNRCLEEDVECVINDDILWILRELKTCDAMVLGSPCYFGTVSSQLKMLMDRSVSIREPQDQLKNKIGVAVVTQDEYGKGRGGELTLFTIRHFYGRHIVYAGGVIGEGGIEKNNVKKDQRAMREAKDMAMRIMELYEMIGKK